VSPHVYVGTLTFLVSLSAVGEDMRSVRLFMKETEADTRLYELSEW
jgi:hypothetical protein